MEKGKLQEFIKENGKKVTAQRMLIMECFRSLEKHLSPEEIFHRIRAEHPTIGRATVYRTLKLMAEADIVDTVEFGDGATRFELKDEASHHDHLICTECGRSIEFVHTQIEELQEKVAKEHDFLPRRHRLEIFGLCGDCRRKQDGKK